jgi:cytochrome c553
MKAFRFLLTVVGGAALVSACTNLERARDLANPAVAGTTLAQQVCINCHGVNGSAVSPNFPNLPAQNPEYVTQQLHGFRSHNRSDPAGFQYMWGLTRKLTDAQIDELAKYYAAQKPSVQPIESSPERIAAGKTLFFAGHPDKGVPACASCHGQLAQGMGAIPRLAGQHADYVIKQLTVFQRSDERPEGSIMKTVAHGLAQTDIENAAAYVQSLQPAQ